MISLEQIKQLRASGVSARSSLAGRSGFLIFAALLFPLLTAPVFFEAHAASNCWLNNNCKFMDLILAGQPEKFIYRLLGLVSLIVLLNFFLGYLTQGLLRVSLARDRKSRFPLGLGVLVGFMGVILFVAYLGLLYHFTKKWLEHLSQQFFEGSLAKTQIYTVLNGLLDITLVTGICTLLFGLVIAWMHFVVRAKNFRTAASAEVRKVNF